MSNPCPACNADNAESNTFCTMCGSAMRLAPTAAPAAESAPAPKKSSRLVRWLVGAAGVLLLVGAVSRLFGPATLDTLDMERQIETSITAQTAAVVDVDCPDDVEMKAGNDFDCSFSGDDGRGTIHVVQTNDEGAIEWEITEVKE